MLEGTQYLWWAVAIGVVSAISLPLGSVAGLVLRPRATVAALLAAFGAGALIAALAVELVAPTVEAIGKHEGATRAFVSMVLGAIAGGVIFVTLDRILAERGGFLRKASTTIAYYTQRRRERDAEWLHDLCAIPALRALPPDQVTLLMRDVRSESFAPGETLFREGEPSTRLFFLRSGEVDLQHRDVSLRQLGTGGILGELGLIAEVPYQATATARSGVEALVLGRADFQRWRSLCPEFDQAVRELASERLENIRQRDEEISTREAEWARQAIGAIQRGALVPSPGEIRKIAAEHGGAPLAVWLGMLIDGIPESIVIGAGFLEQITGRAGAGASVAFFDVVPYTLVAGLFLSNFPEALSSSIGMRTLGWGSARIVGLWTILLVITAAGAGAGYVGGHALPHDVLAAIEGIAAGAMLTAIAAAVIPEAAHLAKSPGRVGLATLFGFLAAISFKLLE